MPKYYCHGCAAILGSLRQPPTDKLIVSSYQLEKYIKHTVPDPRYHIQSVFSTPSTQLYAEYIIESITAGSIEVDDYDRKNIIWVAGERTGFLFNYGQLVQPQDAVKIVLFHDDARMHAYSANSTSFTGTTCDICGEQVIY